TWRFISGNPATVKMFGARNEEDFTCHEPWKLSPERQPDGRASAEKAIGMIETAMREGSHFFEWTHRRLNGEVFPATVLLSCITWAGEAFLQATARDTTEQKRAEEELRQREEKFRLRGDTIPQPAGMPRPDGYIFWYNRRCYEYTGATPEQLEGW